jgi:hypothetical protein
MKTIHGGTKAEAGYYFNRKTWELQNIEEGEALPEGEFVEVPTAGLFVVAPVLGAMFAIFLPFIGFAMTAYGAGKKAADVFGRRAKGAEQHN